MRPSSLGTRLGFGAVDAGAPTPCVVEVPAGDAAEPVALLSVVEVGPATPLAVSDVTFGNDACVVAPVLLLFAADADFVPLPLQARAVATAIETRTERYIFPRLYQQLK